MTAAGAIFLTVSVGGVLSLFGYCVWRVLRQPPPGSGPGDTPPS